ncbi:hypothetical protein BDN72DRAFT_724793, partial [Pluteus cervinus]
KARRRKVPITSQTTTASSTSKASRSVIQQFHRLLKQRLQFRKTLPDDAPPLKAIEKEIGDLGGLEHYQNMSALGQTNERGGGSEKVLVSWMKELGVPRSTSLEDKKRLLEVGAVRPDNYKSCLSWIAPTPIDLHARHPSIQEQDFLLMDPEVHRNAWDIISLSLVLNFVPDPKDRGSAMLKLANSMLTPSGYLFLVLPLPCVANSRYLTFEHLEELMVVLGFRQLKVQWRHHGKIAYWLFRKETDVLTFVPTDFRKRAIRQGNRNNFSI